MREIFGPQETHDPGAVFYTITEADIGHRVIQTEIGPISLGDVIGYVLPADVGKRLYRTPIRGGGWIWQCENSEQFAARVASTAV